MEPAQGMLDGGLPEPTGVRLGRHALHSPSGIRQGVAEALPVPGFVADDAAQFDGSEGCFVRPRVSTGRACLLLFGAAALDDVFDTSFSESRTTMVDGNAQ